MRRRATGAWAILACSVIAAEGTVRKGKGKADYRVTLGMWNRVLFQRFEDLVRGSAVAGRLSAWLKGLPAMVALEIPALVSAVQARADENDPVSLDSEEWAELEESEEWVRKLKPLIPHLTRFGILLYTPEQATLSAGPATLLRLLRDIVQSRSAVPPWLLATPIEGGVNRGHPR